MPGIGPCILGPCMDMAPGPVCIIIGLLIGPLYGGLLYGIFGPILPVGPPPIGPMGSFIILFDMLLIEVIGLPLRDDRADIGPLMLVMFGFIGSGLKLPPPSGRSGLPLRIIMDC